MKGCDFGLNSQKIKNKKFLKGWYACQSEAELGFGLRGKYIYIYIYICIYDTQFCISWIYSIWDKFEKWKVIHLNTNDILM